MITVWHFNVLALALVTERAVRRAKLYYLRDRTGKSARIAEKIRKNIGIDVDVKPETINEENLAPIDSESNKKEEDKKVETKSEPKNEGSKEPKKESSEEKK